MRSQVAGPLVVVMVLLGCGPGVSPHVKVDPALAILAPADTTLMVGVRFDRLRETPFYKKHVSQGRFPEFEALTEKTGASLDELWEILACFDGREMVVMARGKFSERGMEPRLEWDGAQRSSYKGYLLVSDGSTAVTFMNTTTALAGPPDRLRAIIDQRSEDHSPPEALLEMVKDVDRSNQIWAVSTGFVASAEGRQGPMANVDQVLRKINRFRTTMNFNDGLIFEAVGECNEPEEADALQEALRALVGLARFGTRGRPALKALYDKIAILSEERSVIISANLPEELVDELVAEDASTRTE